MRLDSGLDTGPTYESTKLQLGGTETRLGLYEELAELGAELLATKLDAILQGTIVPIPQDSAQSTKTSLIKKADGVIDWTKLAATLEREVRAYLGWPGSRATIAGTDVTITAAHISPEQDGQPGTAYKTPSSELAVYTGSGSLVIDRLKPAGKREMTGLEFLAGHPLP
jgi:methionyl-tRNA formyltransferase